MARKMLMLAAVLSMAAFSFAGKAQNDAYSATVTTSASAGSQHVQLNFRVTKWSTQEEIKRLGAILKEKGQDGLLEELKTLDAGRINRVGDTGNEIAVAEKWQDGDKTVLTMISARRMSLFESNARPNSTNYPFAFLQVTLNPKGEGAGKLVSAASITYDKKKDSFRLEPHGAGATPVTNVKPLDGAGI